MSGARCSACSRAAFAARSSGVSGMRAHAGSSPPLEFESRRQGLRRGPKSDRYLQRQQRSGFGKIPIPSLAALCSGFLI